MSVKLRLQQRRQWCTLKDVAQRLSDEFSKEVTEQDVVELALEGDITLWVRVSGNLNVAPLLPEREVDYRNSPSISPLTGYCHGAKNSETGEVFYDIPGLQGSGVYRLGLDAVAIQHHLQRLAGIEPLGDIGLSSWYLIMDDADGGKPHLFVPLQPGQENKPLPLPSPQSLLVQSVELDAFIAELGDQEPTQANESEELRPSRLLAIAALLDMLKNNTRLKHTQDSIINEIEGRHKGVYGVSKGNLEKLFADANKAMREARKAISP